MRSLFTAFLAALLLLSGSAANGQTPTGAEVPAELRNVDVDEHMGANLPLDLPFVDHTGQAVTLRDYFDGDRGRYCSR
jgi:hypothetical protein